MPGFFKLAFALSLAANAAIGGFILYKLLSRTPPRPATYPAHRDSLFAELPVKRSSVVMVGDSLTDWAEWAELLQNPGVINRAVSGATSADAVRRIGSIVSARPAFIVLMIGFNDLDRGSAVEPVIANYREIFDMMSGPGWHTELIVQSVLPANHTLYPGPAKNRDIRQLNRRIAQLCRAPQCVFLNLHDSFSDADGSLDSRYTYDGVHLNGRGYRIWRDALQPLVGAGQR